MNLPGRLRLLLRSATITARGTEHFQRELAKREAIDRWLAAVAIQLDNADQRDPDYPPCPICGHDVVTVQVGTEGTGRSCAILPCGCHITVDTASGRGLHVTPGEDNR